ncbi:hypothetical protein ACJ73_08143 [Blastomyces percursus]|uniref:Uncharacterized protein n=1 Tax=Blastomyces percursus TaxID=1658174 RepID=A0A1J9QWG3_9EURO|nr:hypothetical protein ACJ73_08143 [Blastomyces percursus]
MSSTPGKHTLSIDDAVAKVLNSAKTIKLRESIKPHEAKRVREAFALLADHRLPSNSTKTSERRDNYRRFLKQINDHDRGPQLVVICAVGIGQSAIASMREVARLNLPEEIKKRANALTDPTIDKIAAEYLSSNVNPSSYIETCVPQQTGLSQPSQSHRPALPPSDADGTLPERPEQQLPGYRTGLFSGRVFELTLHDVQAILMSGQAGSKVWLTETYDNQSLPFIAINISQEMCNYFSTQRHQVA